MGRSVTTAATLTLVSLTVTGCAQPHDGAVREVASAFYEAYAADDGATACDQLAPRTKSELEKSAGKPCAEAVLEESVPAVAGVTDVRVFTTQAQVRWEGETTFLARFRGGWKVMAAVCEPRPGRPYDCALSGG